MFFFLGIAEAGVAVNDTAPNHSPFFRINEAALENGVRALTGLALDFLAAPPKAAP